MRFDNTTKTKIVTEHGTVLKVDYYDADGEHYIDYKIRPRCSICGKVVDCVCYNEDNSDNPFNTALSSLKTKWTCDNSNCLVEFMEKHNPDLLSQIKKEHGNDPDEISYALIAILFIDNVESDGEFCDA